MRHRPRFICCRPLFALLVEAFSRTIAAALFPTGILSFLLVLPIPVHASSALVQQINNGENSSSSTETFSVSFSRNVASGDIVIVAMTGLHGATPESVTDSLLTP